MYYSSTNNEFIKDIKKLNTKKQRDLTDTFLIEGEHLVIEALKKDIVLFVILEEGYKFNTNQKSITVSRNVLKYISSLDNPQPVMAVCKKKTRDDIGSKILILDSIQDPGNLGTIIRSCVAFNVDTLILNEACVDLYNPKVLRASQGMVFHLNIITTDIKETIIKLQRDGYDIIGTDVSNGVSVDTLDKNQKMAIIMGNEGNGISFDIKKLVNKNIYIPMAENCESLNVGVAASIILYELR